jgi:hypothetical protein
VGLGLAAISEVRTSYPRRKREEEEAYHNVGGPDTTLSDMRGDKLRHSPLSEMDMEADISLFLPLLLSYSEAHGLTQPVQVVLSR